MATIIADSYWVFNVPDTILRVFYVFLYSSQNPIRKILLFSPYHR